MYGCGVSGCLSCSIPLISALHKKSGMGQYLARQFAANEENRMSRNSPPLPRRGVFASYRFVLNSSTSGALNLGRRLRHTAVHVQAEINRMTANQEPCAVSGTSGCVSAVADFILRTNTQPPTFCTKLTGTLRDVFLPARVADGRHEVLEILFVLQTTVIENIVPNLAP